MRNNAQMMTKRPPPPMRSQTWRDSRRRLEATSYLPGSVISKLASPGTSSEIPRPLNEPKSDVMSQMDNPIPIAQSKNGHLSIRMTWEGHINETKMSDGGRGRASLGVKVWKSSQKWSVRRSAVRSIALLVRSLWVYWRPWRNDLSAAP